MARMRRTSCVLTVVAVLAVTMPAVRARNDSPRAQAAQAQPAAQAFDLDPKLVAGGTAEMTVTFADGDKLSAPLKIEARGEAMEGMAGHGESH